MSTTTQPVFKVGQQVKLRCEYASLPAGTKLLVRSIDSDGDLRFNKLTGEQIGGRLSPREVERVEVTLDSLMEGDVVVDDDDDSDRCVVLHVLKPGLYVMSEDGDGDTEG